MTSVTGKQTKCVLHIPVVMPLNPANAPCTYTLSNCTSVPKKKLPNHQQLTDAEARRTFKHSLAINVTLFLKINWSYLQRSQLAAIISVSKLLGCGCSSKACNLDYAQFTRDISMRGREMHKLTAFWPSTVQRIASDALARQARIIQVGSMYFTSAGMPTSLKCLLICKNKSCYPEKAA